MGRHFCERKLLHCPVSQLQNLLLLSFTMNTSGFLLYLPGSFCGWWAAQLCTVACSSPRQSPPEMRDRSQQLRDATWREAYAPVAPAHWINCLCRLLLSLHPECVFVVLWMKQGTSPPGAEREDVHWQDLLVLEYKSQESKQKGLFTGLAVSVSQGFQQLFSRLNCVGGCL